jgi:hypothetical protein
MFITNTGRTNGGWFRAVGLAGTMALLCGGPQAARAAKPDVTLRTAAVAVQQIDDYAAANEAARSAGGMLLVSVEPAGAVDTDIAGSHLARPDVQRRFAESGTPWIFCRIGLDQGGVARAYSSSTTGPATMPVGSSRSCPGRPASTTASARTTSTSSPSCPGPR